MITKLKSNQIFVFGSNLAGLHLGGAAKQAYESFGAIWGQGEGLQGQSYAFPTLDEDFGKRDYKELIESRNKLYKSARENPQKEFLLTAVGCGISGYPVGVMKKLFENTPENITKPDEFK